MAYENDARRQEKLLNDSAISSRIERNRINPIIDSSIQWWKGKGAEAFIREYKSIDSEVDVILRSMESAARYFNRLPGLIAQAERERNDAKEKKLTAVLAVAAKVAQKVIK